MACPSFSCRKLCHCTGKCHTCPKDPYKSASGPGVVRTNNLRTCCIYPACNHYRRYIRHHCGRDYRRPCKTGRCSSSSKNSCCLLRCSRWCSSHSPGCSSMTRSPAYKQHSLRHMQSDRISPHHRKPGSFLAQPPSREAKATVVLSLATRSRQAPSASQALQVRLANGDALLRAKA